MIDYRTLKVRIEALGGVRHRTTVRGMDGDGHCEFDLGFGPTDLDALASAVSQPRSARRRIESDESAYARLFGGQLFDLVFQSTARDVLRASLGRARHENMGLRLMLELDAAPQLRNVPWELLWDSPRFISTSAYTPVLRYVDIAARPRPLVLQPPLRILGLVSSPGDMPALDAEREKAQLADSCRSLTERGLLAIDWVADATLSGLLDRLDRFEYHIFHFIGHGDFDEEQQDGVLLFEGRAGRSHRVTGVELATILADQRSLRLAVINACEGARMALDSNGVAANLMQYGLPAVIAMQFEISDEAAIAFARHFYGSIARSHPIDEALADARRGMFAAGHGLEWATPVLFTSLDDGYLFDIDLGAIEQLEPAPSPDSPSPDPEQQTFDAGSVETSAQAVISSQAKQHDRPPGVAAGTEGNRAPASPPTGSAGAGDVSRPAVRVLAGAAAALVALVAAVLALTGAFSGSSGPRVGAAIAVGRSPVGVAIGQGSVWVASYNVGTISKIEPSTGRIVHKTTVGGDPTSIAVPPTGSLWVANFKGDRVTQIDPSSGKVLSRTPVGGEPNTLAIGGDRVWVANSADDTVSSISIASYRVLRVIPVGEHPTGITVGAGAVWVASSGDQTVTRIDPQSSAATGTIRVGRSTQAIAFADGSLWVTDPDEGTVSRIGPHSKQVIGLVRVGRRPRGIAADGSGVWVANSGDGTLSHIDAATGGVVGGIVKLGGQPSAVAAGQSTVWVGNLYDSTVIPIEQ